MDNIYLDEIEISDSDIPRDERKKVYERDGNICQISGMKSNLSLHHIIAKSHGGPGKAENLILVNRKWHDYLHFQEVPGDIYRPDNMYKLARVNTLRDILRIRKIPKNFKQSYDYVRAMFDGINKNDPEFPEKLEITNIEPFQYNWVIYKQTADSPKWNYGYSTDSTGANYYVSMPKYTISIN